MVATTWTVIGPGLCRNRTSHCWCDQVLPWWMCLFFLNACLSFFCWQNRGRYSNALSWCLLSLWTLLAPKLFSKFLSSCQPQIFLTKFSFHLRLRMSWLGLLAPVDGRLDGSKAGRGRKLESFFVCVAHERIRAKRSFAITFCLMSRWRHSKPMWPWRQIFDFGLLVDFGLLASRWLLTFWR